MTTWREMHDPGPYLAAWELRGNGYILTIDRVEQKLVEGESGRKANKPVAFFVGKERGMVLSKTSCKELEKIASSDDPAKWAGLSVLVYPTTTKLGPDTVACLRIKQAPAKAAP